jgi:hypothetical protein
MNDDCTAEWAGLMLRAEAMSRTNWWWAVIDMETRGVIADSHSATTRASNGKQARCAAELAARQWLNSGGDE